MNSEEDHTPEAVMNCILAVGVIILIISILAMVGFV
jgi:hypothetical protein